MRITIIGAGAIGGTTGACLHDAGHDVLLVDNVREHVEAINARGLRISGIRGDRIFKVPACLPQDLRRPLGFVILAVKAQHTEAALAPVIPLLASDGFVLSMQNGVNEEIIARRVGAGRTVGCFLQFGADYQEPGHILLGNDHPIYVGEIDGRITPRAQMIAQTVGAVMPAHVTDNIWGWLWTKMCLASLYFAGALIDVPMKDLLAHRQHRPHLAATVQEAVRVARTQGYTRLEAIGDFRASAFGEGYTAEAEAVFEAIATWKGVSLKIYTGIQRDIMVRRRKTEVDQQPGVVIERAQRFGIPTPYHRATVAMIKEIEDGRRSLAWENLDELARAAAGG